MLPINIFNMKKPEFNDLPWRVQELLWRDVDDLDYDSYDSSREECIANIRNGDISYWNKQKIENLYDQKSVEQISNYCANVRNAVIRELHEMDNVILSFYI